MTVFNSVEFILMDLEFIGNIIVEFDNIGSHQSHLAYAGID